MRVDLSTQCFRNYSHQGIQQIFALLLSKNTNQGPFLILLCFGILQISGLMVLLLQLAVCPTTPPTPVLLQSAWQAARLLCPQPPERMVAPALCQHFRQDCMLNRSWACWLHRKNLDEGTSLALPSSLTSPQLHSLSPEPSTQENKTLGTMNPHPQFCFDIRLLMCTCVSFLEGSTWHWASGKCIATHPSERQGHRLGMWFS